MSNERVTVSVRGVRTQNIEFDVTAAELVKSLKLAYLTKIFGSWRGDERNMYFLHGKYWMGRDGSLSYTNGQPVTKMIREATDFEVEMWQKITDIEKELT